MGQKKSSSFASSSVRELELVSPRALPLGPGQYNGFKFGTIEAKSIKTRGQRTPAFASTSPRFKEPKPATPGPAQYSPRYKKSNSVTHAYSYRPGF